MTTNKNGDTISAAIPSFHAAKETHTAFECLILVISYNFAVNNQKTDNDGRILILDVTINDVNFFLINLYNANEETEQVFVLNNLSSLLESFDVILEKNLILAGDFNLFLSSK